MMHGKGDGTSRLAAQKSCLLSTDFLITPLHCFITLAPLQRLRPVRLAFIPTELVCHLSRSRRAGMKISTDSSLMRKWN
jgi:hypothetical protein